MDLRRALVLLLFVPILLLAGCGGDDDGGDAGKATDSSAQPDDPASSSDTSEQEAPPISTSEDPSGHAAVSAFTLTPALQNCMKQAGFTQDAPPTGGLAAWRHASGGRVVVGSSNDVTVGIASEIGTAERPADVEGAVVIAASEAPAEAARACLGVNETY